MLIGLWVLFVDVGYIVGAARLVFGCCWVTHDNKLVVGF
jgi:hypothetical protein